MGRLRAITIKEFWAVLRDPRSRIVLFVPPLLQLFIFTFASTLDVKNFDVGILDRSGGRAAIEFASQIAGSPNVRHVVPLRSDEALAHAIDNQDVIAAIVLEPDFDVQLARGGAKAGLILDGRRSNAAQIVAGYLQQIAMRTGATLRPGIAAAPPGSIVRHWFNPNLDYLWFTLPALVVILGATTGLAVTGQSIARERELGTFDQLMVSPLRVHEILIGKTVPPICVGLINGTIFLGVSVLLFGVPFTGSILLFFLSLFIYLLALAGIGLFVSAASQTQQQAFLGIFLVSVPVILLSGYASPVDNMPGWLQMISMADPARHFMVIVEGLFLKDMPVSEILSNIVPLILIASVTISLAAWLFRARME
ncbi:ABC transporter permease [Rhizorhapis sp. SPR117]|uniref:ABC transporter permease n=1 Tax=Rhizorhapis sp. SPR117 TaxID=2912611 RepID=UPI001F189F0A|nr:ABC transporter permease [Rhizorhapis sp. SPR117]